MFPKKIMPIIARWLCMGLMAGVPLSVSAASKPSPEQEFERATRLLEESQGKEAAKRCAEAIRILETLSKQSFTKATLFLAELYGEGKGVLQDGAKAVKQLESCANGGDLDALMRLGLVYCNGEWGIEQSRQKAVSYFEQAAEKDDAKALYFLAMLYSQTEINDFAKMLFYCYRFILHLDDKPVSITANVKRNVLERLERATQVQQRAAIDKVIAYYTARTMTTPFVGRLLGNIYLNPFYHCEDPHKAASWYAWAGKRGDAESLCKLGCIKYDEGVSGFDEAVDAYLKSAQLGFVRAYYFLYLVYWKTESLQRDRVRALNYLHLAVQHKIPEAVSRLAYLHLKGKGVKQDFDQAVKLFKEAAALGNPDAYHYLGSMYKTGIGHEIDEQKALQWIEKGIEQFPSYAPLLFALGRFWYECSLETPKMRHQRAERAFVLAADRGMVAAYFFLALIQLEGQIGKKNIPAGVALLEKGAAKDQPDCCFMLAMLLLNGEGALEKNDEQAAEYAQKAAYHKHPAGQALLGMLYLSGQGVRQDLKKAEFYLQEASKKGVADLDKLLDELKRLRAKR